MVDESYDEAPYDVEGEVPTDNKPGIVRALVSRIKGGELHPDATNQVVDAPPLLEDSE